MRKREIEKDNKETLKLLIIIKIKGSFSSTKMIHNRMMKLICIESQGESKLDNKET